MKNKWILLLVGCALIACNDKDVDFGYSPIQPKAGEKIRFTNLSKVGEAWEWAFGDATTLKAKNPIKVYKQPGTYTVTLKVDGKSNLIKVKSITVYDTVPNYLCSVRGADSLGIHVYDDVTFTAQVYNPYNYKVDYSWTIQTEVPYELLSKNTTGESLKVYFKQAAPQVTIRLKVTVNEMTHEVNHVYAVKDVQSTSLLMYTQGKSFLRQRVYGKRAGLVMPLTYAEGKEALNSVQDTVQVYNKKKFKLSELKHDFPDMKGFSIASQKIYFRTDKGLFLANINGTHKVPIWQGTVLSQCADVVHNRIYWALPDSVMYMPLVGADNNMFTTVPVAINNQSNVVKLTIDPVKR